jgi:multicomponent Na+:H+ antiporter subunit G
MNLSLFQVMELVIVGSGVIFLLVASIGVLRLPGFFLRLHAASLARTLGLSAMLLGVAFQAWNGVTTLRVLAILGLFFLTGPLAAHMLGRAVYLRGKQATPRRRLPQPRSPQRRRGSPR